MSNIFMVKWFIYAKSESLLLSVAKVHVHGFDFIFNTRSTWKLGANALFSIQEVLVLVQWYCFDIFEFWIWGHISEPAHMSATAISKLFTTIQLVMRTSLLDI